MANVDDILSMRVEELVKAKKTNKEIAKTLKEEGVKSKKTGKPLTASSVAYYTSGRRRTKSRTIATRTYAKRNRNASLVDVITTLVGKLSPKDRVEVGYRILTSN